jgi:hypothetical protein
MSYPSITNKRFHSTELLNHSNHLPIFNQRNSSTATLSTEKPNGHETETQRTIFTIDTLTLAHYTKKWRYSI